MINNLKTIITHYYQTFIGACIISLYSHRQQSSEVNTIVLSIFQMKTETCMDKEDVIYIYICVCVYIYIYILLTHKNNEIMPFLATWMDLEIIILSEVSQKEKGKYHMISLICGI